MLLEQIEPDNQTSEKINSDESERKLETMLHKNLITNLVLGNKFSNSSGFNSQRSFESFNSTPSKNTNEDLIKESRFETQQRALFGFPVKQENEFKTNFVNMQPSNTFGKNHEGYYF